MILAGDVGGTKTTLALIERGASPRAPHRDARLPSRDYPSFEGMVREFLAAGNERVTHAAVGVAGPVVHQQVEATNLPWRISSTTLGRSLGGAEVVLMNDLETTAWGLAELSDHELEVLHHGEAATGNRALIAAGTGLGEAILMRESRRWRPSASEGGHADFAARDALEDELMVWLRARFGRVSWERVLSGRGLTDLYRFFTDSGRGAEPAAFTASFAAASDPAALVSAAALDGSCERARLVLERWCEIYGAEAGNLALKALAVGGVFVGGGIAPKVLPMLRAGGFARAFTAKGRLAPVMEKIPVAVVLDDRASLWGAASVALAMV